MRGATFVGLLFAVAICVGATISARAEAASEPRPGEVDRPRSSAPQQTEFDFGKQEYESKCAICHGVDGKGHGPFMELLTTVAPSDLTTLAKKNNGVFPVQKLYEVIDGRSGIKSHGTRDMPIWGTSYTFEATILSRPDLISPALAQEVRRLQRSGDIPVPPNNTEAYVRIRILALIDYLDRIQEQAQNR
jgi:mono/diheme cytochrome c family protein